MSQIEDLVNNIFSVFDRYVGCFYSGDRIFLCRDNNGVLDFKEFLIATHQTVRLFVHKQQIENLLGLPLSCLILYDHPDFKVTYVIKVMGLCQAQSQHQLGLIGKQA